MSKLSALIIVDCQNDFVEPSGSLYVPGAETIKDELVKIIKNQEHQFNSIFITQDWHSEQEYTNSEEAKLFPKHCIKGSWGAKVIDEIEVALQSLGEEVLEYRFTKPVFDVWAKSPKFVARVEDELSIDDTIYVCGVATNYCVYDAIKGFINAGFKNVVILTNAVKEIPDDTYAPRMEELKKLGVQFINDIEETAI